MSLQKVLEEIKKLQPFADENTDTGEAATLNARRGRKNQAIEQLKVLKRDYTKELLKSALFIVSTGQNREDFAKVASEDFGCFVADPDEFYKDLAGRVPEVLYLGKEGVSNLFDVLGRHLEDKMMELDINEYNQLIFKAVYQKSIDSKESFTSVVKEAINNQIGSEIAGIQAIKTLVGAAIEKNHSAAITPIILSTADEKFALSLVKDLQRLTPRIFLTVSGKSSKVLKSVDGAMLIKEATKETVEQTLTAIRKEIKAK